MSGHVFMLRWGAKTCVFYLEHQICPAVRPCRVRSEMLMEDSFMLYFRKLNQKHPGVWKVHKVNAYSVKLIALKIGNVKFTVNKYFEYYNWTGKNPYTGGYMDCGHYEIGKEDEGMTRNANRHIMRDLTYFNYDPKIFRENGLIPTVVSSLRNGSQPAGTYHDPKSQHTTQHDVPDSVCRTKHDLTNESQTDSSLDGQPVRRLGVIPTTSQLGLTNGSQPDREYEFQHSQHEPNNGSQHAPKNGSQPDPKIGSQPDPSPDMQPVRRKDVMPTAALEISSESPAEHINPDYMTNKQLRLQQRLVTEKLIGQRERMFPYDYSNEIEAGRAHKMYHQTMNHIENLLLKLAYIHGTVNNVNHSARFIRSDEIPCSQYCLSDCPNCPVSQSFPELVTEIQTYLMGCCKKHSTRSTIQKKSVKVKSVDLSRRDIESENQTEHAFVRFQKLNVVCMRLLQNNRNWGRFFPNSVQYTSKTDLESKFKKLYMDRTVNSPSVKDMWNALEHVNPSKKKGITMKDYENLLISLTILAEVEEEPFSIQLQDKRNQRVPSQEIFRKEYQISTVADSNHDMGQDVNQKASRITVTALPNPTRDDPPLTDSFPCDTLSTVTAIQNETQNNPPLTESLPSNDSTENVNEEYEVEKVVGKRYKFKKLEYLIKWADYDGPDTWEKAVDLNCDELIEEYHRAQKALTPVIKNKRKRK
ncbi:hypothetical protein BC833DRAFT_569830, partial [Globomyces pollinis-pini]